MGTSARRQPLVQVVVVAFLLSLVSMPAAAETVTRNDAAGDVADGPDITSFTVSNRPREIVIRLLVDGLRPRHVWAYVDLEPQSTDYAYYIYSEYDGFVRTTTLERLDYAAEVDEGEQVPSESVRCEGLQSTARRAGGRLTVRVPQKCLGESAGVMGARAWVGDDGFSEVDLTDRYVTTRRGELEEPEPLVQGQGGSTTCVPRFGEEHLTLGYSSLRNTSDTSIVVDDVRLRGVRGFRLLRAHLVPIAHVGREYWSFGIQHGYPPRFSYREGRVAWRHRRPVPGATVAPGEVLDIVLHVRKTTPGRARLDTRVVKYHDADGRSYTWRDHNTVILRGGDSCF